jgi:hypothetical protein
MSKFQITPEYLELKSAEALEIGNHLESIVVEINAYIADFEARLSFGDKDDFMYELKERSKYLDLLIDDWACFADYCKYGSEKITERQNEDLNRKSHGILGVNRKV